MRVNTAKSIRTANAVHNRFGSWKAAKASADFKDGKFVVRSASTGKLVTEKSGADPKHRKD
jgi:hypothetical protein